MKAEAQDRVERSRSETFECRADFDCCLLEYQPYIEGLGKWFAKDDVVAQDLAQNTNEKLIRYWMGFPKEFGQRTYIRRVACGCWFEMTSRQKILSLVTLFDDVDAAVFLADHSLEKRLKMARARSNQDGRVLRGWVTKSQLEDLQNDPNVMYTSVYFHGSSGGNFETLELGCRNRALLWWEVRDALTSVCAALHHEDPRGAMVFKLYYLEGKSLDEVAVKVGQAPRTCQKDLERFVKMMILRFPEVKEYLRDIARRGEWVMRELAS